MNIFKKIIRKTKKQLDDLVKTEQTPHSVAFGFAVGTFISTMPTPGFNILLGILIAYLSRKINKISLFIGILIWNPLLVPITYSLSFKIGQIVFDDHTIINSLTVTEIWNNLRIFLVGITVLATFVTIMSYFLVYIAVYLYQKKLKQIEII